MKQPAWVHDTIHRLVVQVVRMWVVTHYLRSSTLIKPLTMWCYPDSGEYGFGWGDAPDLLGGDAPLRGKRVRVTFVVEASDCAEVARDAKEQV